MFQVSRSASTSTGVARSYRTGLAEATKVSVGTSTSSPGPTSSRRRATWMAAVPLAQATAWRAPTQAANSRSKRSTKGPTDET